MGEDKELVFILFVASVFFIVSGALGGYKYGRYKEALMWQHLIPQEMITLCNECRNLQ